MSGAIICLAKFDAGDQIQRRLGDVTIRMTIFILYLGPS